MAARSKHSLSQGEPLRKCKLPKTWTKHEHQAMQDLVGQTFDLPTTPSRYIPGETYEGGQLHITSIIVTSPLIYIYGGHLNDQPVVIKATFAVLLGASTEPTLHRLYGDINHHSTLKQRGITSIPYFHGTWQFRSFGLYVIQRLPQDLATYIAQTKPSLPLIYDWARQLLAILEQFHVQGGLAHMDLKPANIVIDEAGTLYLIDFEICWRANTLQIRYERTLELGWEPLVGDGTVPYKSTQAHYPRRARIGYRSDLESLVFVLEALITETLPWQTLTEPDAVYTSKMGFTSVDPVVQRLWQYTRGLEAADIPDYTTLRQWFEC